MKAVLLDMDGTLVDTEGLWRRAELELASAYGVRLEPALQARFEGLEVSAVARILQESFALPATVEALEHELNARALALVTAAPEREGAAALVAWLVENDLARAVVSNSPRHVVEATLAPHSWAASLPQRFAAGEGIAAKPAPDLYLLAARSLGVSPSSCVAVEDSPTGAAAALAAGMRCLAVPSSAHARTGMAALGLRSLGGLRGALKALQHLPRGFTGLELAL